MDAGKYECMSEPCILRQVQFDLIRNGDELKLSDI